MPATPLKLAHWSLHLYRLPYEREVKWANAVESAGTLALLRLVSDGGAVGIAEGTINANRSGVSPRSLAAALEDLVVPRLRDLDLADADAVSRALRPIPDNRQAKAMAESACWTLRAAAEGTPLWRLWGGTREVEVTWTVTLQDPPQMAAEAAGVCAKYGFRSLKVKGGQGLATDLEALARIRAAVGADVELFVDANGRYSRGEALAYVRAIAEAGSTFAEDPCPLAPDEAFTALQAASPIPILVDRSCASSDDAALFLERGAQALSTKPTRVGLTETRAIAALAAKRGARVAVGVFSESALGTLISLQQDSAIPAAQRIAPAEQTFFLGMREQVLLQEVRVAGGRIALPESAGFDSLIDWPRVKRLQI